MLIAGMTQDRVGMPLTNTMQVPQIPIPQLYFVPVIFNMSLRAHRRGMSGGTSTTWVCPFILKVIWLMLIPELQRNAANKLRLRGVRLNSGMPKLTSTVPLSAVHDVD
jgi:hypothetical protein